MAYKKIIGIYLIQSRIKPERIYIGCAQNIGSRWNQHKNKLLQNKHHSPQLQRHYAKYGMDDLIFEIVESEIYVNKNHLLSREQMWFGRFEYQNTDIPYFNCDKIAGSRLGSKATDETRRKQSEQRKGKKLGPNGGGYKYTTEQSQRRSEQQIGDKNHQWGNHGTIQTNKKKSDSHKGLKHSKETIAKLKEINLRSQDNKKVSEETRSKISIANKGTNNPNFGKHLSEDSKLRQREMIYLSQFIKEMEEKNKNKAA